MNTGSITGLVSSASIEPNTGSIAGGAFVKISGNGFTSKTKIKIGGAYCRIEDIKPSEIRCQIKKPDFPETVNDKPQAVKIE